MTMLDAFRQHLAYLLERATGPLPDPKNLAACLFLSTHADCANEIRLAREAIKEWKEMERPGVGSITDA